MKLIDKSPTKDPDLAQFQDRVRQAVNPVLALALLDGREIAVTVPPTGSTVKVEHKLDRAWRGWFLTDISSGVLVWRSSNFQPTRFLELEQSGVVDLDIKIYVY